MARQPTENRRSMRPPQIETGSASGQKPPVSVQQPLRSNPANENDPSTAMMMRRLRRAPAYDGIWISVLISIGWAIGWFFGYKDVLTGGQALSLWGYMQALAWLVLPPAAMVAIAFNMWRSQQLRNTSEVLMQQAIRLINPQDIATDGLTSIAQTVRQEVDLLVGGVEHALQRATALEEIVHKEVSAVERAFGSNEERIRSLVNGLETQRAALQQTSAQVAAESQPMLQRLEANTQGLSQVVNVALSTFSRIEEGLKTSSEDLSQTIDVVSARTFETTQAIGQQSQQFERISTILLSDFRGFSGELQTQMQSLGATAINLGNETRKFNTEIQGIEQSITGQFSSTTDNIISELEGANTRFHERFNDSTSRLALHLDQTSQGLASQLSLSGNGVIGAVQQSAENYVRALTEAHARNESLASSLQGDLSRTSSLLAQEMQMAGSSVNDLLVSTSGTIAAHLKETSDIVSRQMQDSGFALSQNMESAGGNLTDKLITISGEFVQKLSGARDGLLTSFLGASGDLILKLEGTSTTIFGKMQSTTAEVTQRLEVVGNVLGDLMQSTSADVTQRLEAVGGKVDDLLHTSSADVTQRLEVVGNVLGDLMQSTSADVTQRLEDVGGKVGDLLHIRSADVTLRLEDIGNKVGDMIHSRSADVTQRLEGISNKVGNLMSSTSANLTVHLEQVGNEFGDLMQSTSAEVTQRLVSVGTKVGDKMQTTSVDVTQRIEDVGGKVADQIQTTSADVTQRLGGISSRVGDLMESTSADVRLRVEKIGSELGNLMQSTGADVTLRITGVSSELVDLMKSTNTGLAEQLDVTARQLTQRLANTAKNIDQQLSDATERLDVVASDVNSKIDDHGKAYAGALNDATIRIFTDLGRARDTFTESLGHTTLQIFGHLEKESGLIITHIDKAATDLDTAAGASTRKLREASELFAKHITGTQGLLADQLTEAATDIDQRLENVSLQLTGKLEGTGSRISERLDDVSALVDKSVEKFNLEIEHTLQSRRDMLDGLVNDANRRAGEVDKTMSNYMTMIEESLTAAEERARHLGRIVADQSNAALANLEEQLKKLETNSGGQVAQAARALREQHERALSNMNEMLSSTASDFQQTAQDMRITAQQVVKDIDVARGELKRAVIDLPEETRNNADAMRRVVADQIGALNALAEVVRKQSGSLDYSSPGFAAPRMAIAQSKPEAYGPAPIATLTRAEPPQNSSGLASLAREIEAANSKLNVSARDIVEAIEGQLPRDLERRYAGTDKGTYTKRLFDSRSRKLIKALEGRYGEERLLRSRIQAYNRLFEKLLDTVTASEGSEAVMEQILASDQGRIYMMLAEVAGRLPSQG